MKLIDLLNLDRAWGVVMQQETSFKTALALNKLLKSFETEFKVLNEKNNAIVAKYTKDEIVDQVNADKEFNELLQTEVEVNFEPINTSLLEDIKIKPATLAGLMPFVIENNQ